MLAKRNSYTARMARSGIKVKRHGITVPEMEAKLRSGDAELNYCRGCLPRRLGLRSTSSAAVIRAKFNRFKPEFDPRLPETAIATEMARIVKVRKVSDQSSPGAVQTI